MQTLNRYVRQAANGGTHRPAQHQSYFEVPERDLQGDDAALTGIRFKGHTVRCNDADEGDKAAKAVPTA